MFLRFEVKHLLRVRLVQFLLADIADRKIVGDLHLARHELIGIVHRIEYAINPQHFLAIQNRRLPRHSARGDVNILLDIVARLLFQLRVIREPVVHLVGPLKKIDPEQPIGQALPEVANHHLQPGKTIEHTAHDDSQDVQAGLHGKAVDSPAQAPFAKRRKHLSRGRCGMQVNRYVQRLSGREHFPEFLVIQIFALRVRVNDGALQPQFRDASLQFLRRAGWVLRGDGR